MKNSIPVRNRASGRQSSCKLGIKDYSIHRNSPQRNAMLCVEFGWMLACMPVCEQVCDRYENWRPSRRKRWVGGGNGRCAHRRINDPRAGSRPGRVRYQHLLFGTSNDTEIQEMQSIIIIKGGDLSQTHKNPRAQQKTRNTEEMQRSLQRAEISPKPTTTRPFGRGLATSVRSCFGCVEYGRT